MEAGEENGGNNNLKRQRTPLSDSEDNVLTSEVKESQKRRRLEAAGQENRSPKPSSSRRLAEFETKPDTPIVPSVRSRVQQITRRRDGEAPLAQRCLSDPGTDSPSNGLRAHLLGEGEFHQRMERFKVPVFQTSPAPMLSPTSPSPRMCSNFVSGIQQKLQCTTTPSSQEASRMREERKQELNRLQPISENAWLKRSNSDPSLSQDDCDAEMKDGSFTETLAYCAEKQSSYETGEGAPCGSETPAASVELVNSNAGQLQMERKEHNIQQGEHVKEKAEHKASTGNHGKQIEYQHSQTQTVVKLSFSEDQSHGDDQELSELPIGDEKSLLESNPPEDSNMMETFEASKLSEQAVCEVFSFKEVEEINGYSYSEEEIEPSTDEEQRLWRYPPDNVCTEEESIIAEEQGGETCAEEEEVESSRIEKEKGSGVVDGSGIKDAECLANVSVETAGSSEMQEDNKSRPVEAGVGSESYLDDSVKDQCTLNKCQANMESCEECSDGALTGDLDNFMIKQDQKDKERFIHNEDTYPKSKAIVTVNITEENIALKLERGSSNYIMKQTEESHFARVDQVLKETRSRYAELEADVAMVESEAESSAVDRSDGAQCLSGVHVSDKMLETVDMEQDVVDESQDAENALTAETHKAEAGESSKKVTFILEPELINDSSLSETSTSMDSRAEIHMSDAELSSHDETNTAEIIDQMFEEVLEYAGRVEQEKGDNDENAEDHDSGICACSADKDKMDTESEKERSEEEAEAKEEEYDESKKLESNGDELLTFPLSGILSPLSKSVEAVVTPLRLAVSLESNPPSLLLTPEDSSTPPAESAPLYSVDDYRTQRQNKQPSIQSVTPGVQRRAPQKSQPQPSANTKERITALSEEAGKLQSVINQTLQALSFCTDEGHGRGSLEEAEAEKLLLVSCEKRTALLAEVTRLREARSSESEEAAGVDKDYVSQQPCRGTVSITNIQLPLKVEFVCSSHKRTGRPSHYFFILIRYGPCNIVATPLATAADAQNGDTISFPTSVTLEDIRSSFEIDVEVYSLSHTSSSNCSVDRATTKSRVTPRKLLNTLTRSSNSLTPAALPALNTRRSSNFFLVGSHKITLASLGHSKFPLDKMKLEGKIRRLLGDEFQEKVPFLSPLEGNIYLRLDSESHSNVQHQGFLSMFELISGYGVWHRRYFVLEGCNMHYWNHPNDKEAKDAEGSLSLSSSPSRSVRPVKRDSCARPFTFELVSNIQQQHDENQEALAKCWFSADTKQDRLDWMEKLNQALLDFHTWDRSSATGTGSQQSNSSSSGNLRESIL